MDTIVIACKRCGRPLVTCPTMKARRCAACGAATRVLAFQREQAIPTSEVAGKVAAKAKEPLLDPGKTAPPPHRQGVTTISIERFRADAWASEASNPS
ncbi:MAG: hypothetical protein JW839_05830 [Candidatus Lokiarchaeota archaeon]|nr:hypothetical protein [Candidatus Lokiarchaeota archaeon]